MRNFGAREKSSSGSRGDAILRSMVATIFFLLIATGSTLDVVAADDTAVQAGVVHGVQGLIGAEHDGIDMQVEASMQYSSDSR